MSDFFLPWLSESCWWGETCHCVSNDKVGSVEQALLNLMVLNLHPNLSSTFSRWSCSLHIHKRQELKASCLVRLTGCLTLLSATSFSSLDVQVATSVCIVQENWWEWQRDSLSLLHFLLSAQASKQRRLLQAASTGIPAAFPLLQEPQHSWHAIL